MAEGGVPEKELEELERRIAEKPPILLTDDSPQNIAGVFDVGQSGHAEGLGAEAGRRSESSGRILLPIVQRLPPGTDAAFQNSQLMLASVIEMLCTLSEDSFSKQKQLYKVISKSLIKAQMLPPSLFADELHPVRDQFRLALSCLLNQAKDLVAGGKIEHDAFRAALAATNGAATSNLTLSPRSALKISSQALLKFRRGPPESEDFFPSRYSQEFEERSPLGKGGFGHVYKVKCKLDECEYAIKKIDFDVSNSDLCLKVQREVKMLALLKHENVVRYYGSWLEFGARENQRRRWKNSESGLKIRELSEESETNNQHKPASLRRVLTTPSISFADSGGSLAAAGRNKDLDNEEPNFATQPKAKTFPQVAATSGLESSSETESAPGFWARRGLSKSQDDLSDPNFHWADSNEEGDTSGRSGVFEGSFPSELGLVAKKVLPFTRSLTLFVQMELCSLTLKDYISQRNVGLVNSEHQDPFRFVDRKLNEKIIRQLLKGLHYIHSQGLIHRDIKLAFRALAGFLCSKSRITQTSLMKLIFIQPGNIFLRLPGYTVLLGDFGLACFDFPKEEDETELEDNKAGPSRRGGHSSGVGTKTYSAPEQLTSSHYDSKVDLFSVGLVSFELYFPFGTYSEKFHHLTKLRTGEVDETFQLSWPTESAIIRQLTHQNPKLRPCAQELLAGNFFHSKDEVIRDLQFTVDSQAKEIERLRLLLAQRSHLPPANDFDAL